MSYSGAEAVLRRARGMGVMLPMMDGDDSSSFVRENLVYATAPVDVAASLDVPVPGMTVADLPSAPSVTNLLAKETPAPAGLITTPASGIPTWAIVAAAIGAFLLLM